MVDALFGNSAKKAQEAAERDRQLAQVAQQRSLQTAQDEAAQAGGQLAGIKSVRGQRLLLSAESGGTGETMGTA